jgi:restriction endonuclease S subunit
VRARIQKDDVLIAVKGVTIASEKSVCFIDVDITNTIINGSIYRITPKPNVIPKFLAHVLDLPFVKRQMKLNLVSNNAVDYLDTTLIKNLLVPFPENSTQENIIKFLDNARQAKTTKEAEAKQMLDGIDAYLLDKLDIETPAAAETKKTFYTRSSKLSGGRFDPFYHHADYNLLEKELHEAKYPIVNLSKVCNKITDGTHYTPKYQDSGVLFLSVKNVRCERFDLRDVKYISEAEHADLTKRCKPELNDILLTKIGTVGLAAVVPDSLPEFSIFVSLALLKPKFELINPHYLSAFLNSSLTNFQAQRAVKGVGVPDWHLENIRRTIIPFPPLEVQEEIAAHIGSIRERAKQLETEAKREVEQAKAEVEKMILGAA